MGGKTVGDWGQAHSRARNARESNDTKVEAALREKRDAERSVALMHIKWILESPYVTDPAWVIRIRTNLLENPTLVPARREQVALERLLFSLHLRDLNGGESKPRSPEEVEAARAKRRALVAAVQERGKFREKINQAAFRPQGEPPPKPPRKVSVGDY